MGLGGPRPEDNEHRSAAEVRAADEARAPRERCPLNAGIEREPAGDQQCERRQRRQDVVLLPRGEAEEEDRQQSPYCKQQEDTRRGMPAQVVEHLVEMRGAACAEIANDAAEEMRERAERLEEKRRPGHQPHQAQSPEEPQRHGVVIARDAEVQIAQYLLVNEVEPGPAVDVSLGGQRHEEVRSAGRRTGFNRWSSPSWWHRCTSARRSVVSITRTLRAS